MNDCKMAGNAKQRISPCTIDWRRKIFSCRTVDGCSCGVKKAVVFA